MNSKIKLFRKFISMLKDARRESLAHAHFHKRQSMRMKIVFIASDKLHESSEAEREQSKYNRYPTNIGKQLFPVASTLNP